MPAANGVVTATGPRFVVRKYVATPDNPYAPVPLSAATDVYDSNFGYYGYTDPDTVSSTFDSPYTANANWQQARAVNPASNTTQDIIEMTFYCKPAANVTVHMLVFQSGADDATLSRFICVPYLGAVV